MPDTSGVTCGAVEAVDHESAVLRDNALGDPARRKLFVYTPPGYADGRRYPVIWLLSGFTGTGRSQLNWSPWQESLPERLDRLIGTGMLPPCLLALPDCFTRLGGSQYVNSRAIGRYTDYLCDELIPLVDARFRTLGAPGRAIAGKSSGGIGALWQCLERPGAFAACASQAGDCAFELSLQRDFAPAAVALEAAGGMEAFWPRRLRNEPPGPGEHTLLNIVACAAAYSPQPAPEPWGFSLPFDPRTGVTVAPVFEHWLRFDPVRAVRARPEGLRRLSALHLDAGKSDEYNLQLGARLLSRALDELGIAHLHDEFPGGHRNTAHRWDVSLPQLLARLPGPQ